MRKCLLAPLLIAAIAYTEREIGLRKPSGGIPDWVLFVLAIPLAAVILWLCSVVVGLLVMNPQLFWSRLSQRCRDQRVYIWQGQLHDVGP